MAVRIDSFAERDAHVFVPDGRDVSDWCCQKCGFEPHLERMFITMPGYQGMVYWNECPFRTTAIPHVERRPLPPLASRIAQRLLRIMLR